MPRTQITGDLVQDGSIGFEDLSESVNSYGAKEPKIFRVSGHHSNFQEINYTILNLFPQRFFNKGELHRCEWYRDQELTDKVLIVDIIYERDSAGFALTRTTTRTWVNNDNTLNPYTKVTVKDYTINHGETIKEGKKRREALVDNIQVPVLHAMHEVLVPLAWAPSDIILNARDFMDKYDHEFNKFIKNSSTVTKKSDPNYGRKTIVVAFEQESDAQYMIWLDTPVTIFGGATIREFLMNEFNI